jgi:hypothetical protein
LFLICFTDFFLDALQKEKFNFLVTYHTYQLNAKLKDNFLDAIRLQKKNALTEVFLFSIFRLFSLFSKSLFELSFEEPQFVDTHAQADFKNFLFDHIRCIGFEQ